MSESKNTRLIRQVSVGIVIGLILGVGIGLLIGWVIRPVEYKQAYTYQLVDDEKQQYVAAVIDSYNLTKQLGVAQGRLNTWTRARRKKHSRWLPWLRSYSVWKAGTRRSSMR